MATPWILDHACDACDDCGDYPCQCVVCPACRETVHSGTVDDDDLCEDCSGHTCECHGELVCPGEPARAGVGEGVADVA